MSHLLAEVARQLCGLVPAELTPAVGSGILAVNDLLPLCVYESGREKNMSPSRGLPDHGRGAVSPPRDIEHGVVESADDVDLVRATLSLGGVPWTELDDGLQQVRLKMLESEYRADSGQDAIRSRRAWLSVVSSRVAVDWHRRNARDGRLYSRLAEDLRSYWSLGGASGGDLEQERLNAIVVADALQALPDKQRQALVLRYWADLTVPEIAACLDVPHGTVKSRIHAATARLRDVLGGASGARERDADEAVRPRWGHTPDRWKE